ncbi:hypothetical protein E2C01_051233 [Portunus trituberculatus]|uniref:Uncharacterized protein n=1 Tax=Portunus trituberculatus TaxID=210409 RepID=A0A5B7GIL8_PORTR|nr:hypothetical protein [Portunus trituberculatus]
MKSKFDMSHPCGLSDERIQQLLAEETVGFTGEITFTEAYEPVTADLLVDKVVSMGSGRSPSVGSNSTMYRLETAICRVV